MSYKYIKAILILIYYSIYEKYPDTSVLDELEEYGINKIDLIKHITDIYILQDSNPHNTPQNYTIFDILEDPLFIYEFNNIDVNDMAVVNELLQNDDIVNYVLSIANHEQLQTESLDYFRFATENTKIDKDTELTGKYKYVIHKHDAKRAGTHYDLRIEVEKDYVYSIAFRYNPLTNDKAMGVVQPLHTSQWLNFEGEIEEGYGKGKLKIISNGTAQFFKSEHTIVIKLNDVKNTKVYQFAVIKLKEKNQLLFVKTKKEYTEHPTFKDVDSYFYLLKDEKISV